MSLELDWLKRWKMYAPRSVALKDGETGREVTYADFHRFASCGASLLAREYGIKHGDRVAVLSPNELEYVFLFFALQRLGAIMVPINFRLTPREVEHIMRDSDPKLLVFHEDFHGLVNELSSSVRPARTLRLLGPDSFAAKLSTEAETETAFAATEEDACMIIYTSGTTGSPKGAVLTHKMIFWNSINTTMRLNINESDSTVIFLPFFHTGGWNVLTNPFLHRGAKIILLKKFDADLILSLTESEKCTLLFGVPTTMDMMARSPVFARVGLKSVRYAIVGGEPMPLELIHTWHAKGIPVRQGYGLTEFGPSVFSLNEGDAIRKIGSIGFPNFYIDARVLDEDGRECAADEVGELVLRGPACMKGYWRNEKATAETIVGEWLHTGDLVRRDDEGYYFVVGRKKDMYKSGGENVYPAELEQVLRALPGIREAAVIGVPDERWGEVGCAYLVREHDELDELDEETVRSHCLRNLAKFKVPRYYEFLAALPKGDSGKILKKALRDAPGTLRR